MRIRGSSVLAAVAICAILGGCTQYDLGRLAGDDTDGRNNNTPGSTLARQFLIDQLKPISTGLNTAATGDAAYTQSLPGGTNVVAVIPVPTSRISTSSWAPTTTISATPASSSRPATRSATGPPTTRPGSAAVLAIARSIAAQATKPRRSVVIALWDAEEDGLVGSRYYADHPLVPLASTVGYVNFDIQGANLSPSLRNTSFAVASESGGDRFEQIVHSAINASTLDTETLSSIFGQNRSDYVSFLAKQVPSVFFTDATGPCYHTSDDEIGIVDFSKLDQQIAIALRVTRELANTSSPPTFAANTPLVVVLGRGGAAAGDGAALAGQGPLLGRGSGHAEHDQGGSDSDRAGRPVRLRKRRREHRPRARRHGGHPILPKGACDGFLAPADQQAARAVERFALQARSP